MGEQAWREPAHGAPADGEESRRQVVALEQTNTDLTERLEEREAEVEAARATDRELTVNKRGAVR